MTHNCIQLKELNVVWRHTNVVCSEKSLNLVRLTQHSAIIPMIFTWNVAVNRAPINRVSNEMPIYRKLTCIKSNALAIFVLFAFYLINFISFAPISIHRKTNLTILLWHSKIKGYSLKVRRRHDEHCWQTQSCSRWVSAAWCHVPNWRCIASCRISWPLLRWVPPIRPER